MTSSLVSRVTVRGGQLYLSAALCEQYLSGLDSVILLRRAGDLLILPVRHPAAGGYLLKRRNRAGDRVVSAPDFFREQGFDDEAEFCAPAVWSEDNGGLVIRPAVEL